jgi:hypothetical protein
MIRSPIRPLDTLCDTGAGGSRQRPQGTRGRAATRGLTLALLLALLLAGCSVGGTTRPGGYTCVAAPSQYGCWTLLSITPTHLNVSDGNYDIDGNPLFAQSDVLVTPLSCDAACQASSGGGGNPPGFIANVMQLSQSSTNWFIRVGYETTPSSGTQYFLQYYLGDVSPPNATILLTATQIEPGFTGTDPYAGIDIGQGNPLPPPTPWPVNLHPGHPPGASVLSYVIGTTAFQPDYLFSGQVVYGTSGATAIIAAFTNNFISTLVDGLPRYLQEDGTPPGTVRAADHPTDAGWLVHPSSANSSTGGIFYVSCCQP